MVRSCEICSGLGLAANVQRPRFLRIEERIFVLCAAHARECRGARKVAEVTGLYREKYGKRSVVDRRAPTERRVFPPRPEGRRSEAGRRLTDD